MEKVCGYYIEGEGKCDIETVKKDFIVNSESDKCIGRDECGIYEEWIDGLKAGKKIKEELKEAKENMPKYAKANDNILCWSCAYYNAGDGCERVMCIHKENELKEDFANKLKEKEEEKVLTGRDLWEQMRKEGNEIEEKYRKELEESKPTSYFEDITQEMFELYQVKNKNYGNSFSEQFKDYGMTSVCIRLDDKIRRLKSLNKQGTDGTNEESIRDTLIDLANYSVLAIIELDRKEQGE